MRYWLESVFGILSVTLILGMFSVPTALGILSTAGFKSVPWIVAGLAGWILAVTLQAAMLAWIFIKAPPKVTRYVGMGLWLTYCTFAMVAVIGFLEPEKGAARAFIEGAAIVIAGNVIAMLLNRRDQRS